MAQAAPASKLLTKDDDFDVEGKRLGGEEKKGIRLNADGTFDLSKEQQQAAVCVCVCIYIHTYR